MISSVCILYYYFSYQLLKQVKFNFIHYFILFSPLFYFFFVVISKVGVKKEILLYLFYIIYLLNLSSKNYNLSNNWKYFLTYFLLLFNHEVAFFYLPYLILPLLFVIKKNNFRINVQKNIPHGSGLGGGSSNAANLINFLNLKMKFFLVEFSPNFY